MPPWSFVVPKSALLSLVLPGRDITPKVGGFFRFDATSEFVDGGWNWYLFYEPVAINRNQLCILAEEFARLSHEVFAESSATPPSEDLTLQPGLRQTTQEVSADPIAEPPDQELRSGALLTQHVRRWTQEELDKLAKYREQHGTKAAAERFRISTARVRRLLPKSGATARPTANNPFPRRGR